VHVLTKERSNEKPVDFNMGPSRDSSGKQRSHGQADPNCLYCQNIPLFWTSADLRAHFVQFGMIV
jgi:RNA recognition motif-containing protein